MKDDERLSWTNETMDPPSLQAFFDANKENREKAEEDRAAVTHTRVLFNVGCLIVGALGLVSATVTHVMKPPPAPPQFIPFDSRTAWVADPVSARELPTLYTAATREHAIQNYIMTCESFIPQTWATVDYKSCALMSTPAEQKRREAEYGASNSPNYLPTVFKNGYAALAQFPETGFVPIGESGSDPTKVYVYRIRFQRIEMTNSVQTKPWYTGEIRFTFRPDLKMTVADRRINPSGMQVIDFIKTKD